MEAASRFSVVRLLAGESSLATPARQSARRVGDPLTERPTLTQQQADALVLLAESALHGTLNPGASGERYQIVVHVDAPVLADPEQRARFIETIGRNAALLTTLLGNILALTTLEQGAGPERDSAASIDTVFRRVAQPLAAEAEQKDVRLEAAGDLPDLAVEPAALEFEAGQWVSVPFGPKIVRAYSIASTPASGSLITLCADVAPGGVGSQWFRRLATGTMVQFKGPLGGFVFDRADPRRPLFVAEEIGIVPIRSILADLHETGFGRDTVLVFWARDPGWLAYHGDFISLARRSPGFAYHPVVQSRTAGWAGQTGSVIEAVERHAPASDGLVAYVAGGEQTIRAVRDLLVGRGLERKAVKWEKFW